MIISKDLGQPYFFYLFFTKISLYAFNVCPVEGLFEILNGRWKAKVILISKDMIGRMHRCTGVKSVRVYTVYRCLGVRVYTVNMSTQ